MKAPIPEVSSISPLCQDADVWLVDIWGVLHNGIRPFLSAGEACRKFRDHGGRVILVSNSPRPAEGVARQLRDIGVDEQAYDAIITSGDVSRELIAAYAGQGIFHLGPDRDLGVYDGTGVQRVAPNEAAVVVCTGLFDDERESPQDYRTRLEEFAKRKLELICVNPDVTAERGGRLIYCAGALAELYGQLGGVVHYAGKPFAPIYDAAEAIAAALMGAPVPRFRMLAIGDGAKTDILGAARAGIASVFVASGVSVNKGEALSDAAQRLFPDDLVRPVAVMKMLSW